jgi:hypothetical protein
MALRILPEKWKQSSAHGAATRIITAFHTKERVICVHSLP